MRSVRAVRPLDQAAVEAANDAVRAETGGRPLTMGSEDEDLRKKWMAAYEAAGGKVEIIDTGPKGDPKKPVQPCCCKPISSIEIQSVEFLSDHNLLKNNETTWLDTGSKYAVPEWVNARAKQSPISHTMDQPVKAKVKLKVAPPDACSEKGSFNGTGALGLMFDNPNVTYRPGVQELTVTSSNKLPREVQKADLSIDWTANAESTSGSGTSQNDLYVTIDTPINQKKQEDGVTLKRMETAVELVSAAASLDPHEIVASLMKLLPAYTLERNMAVPAAYTHPTYFNTVGGAWPMAENMDKVGECQAIVRFVRGVIKQVGCPGEALTMLVWSDPDVSKGTVARESEWDKGGGLGPKVKVVKGKKWFAALADRPVTLGGVYTVKNMGMNNFEACLKFTHGGRTKYYGGGAGTYDKPDEVLHAFTALVWITIETVPPGIDQYEIMEVVQLY